MTRRDNQRDNQKDRPKDRPKDRQSDRQKDRRPFYAKDKPRSRAPEGLWLYGIHAVKAALANPNRKVLRAVTTERAAQEIGSKLL